MSEFESKIVKLRGTLADYRKQRQAILSDQDLSNEGMAKRLKELDGQSRANAEAEFARLWGDMRAAERAVNVALAKAQSDEAARWDYARLGVELAEARARLASAHNVAEVEAAYRAATDPYRARAVRAAALEVLPKFLNGPAGGPNVDANRLLQQVRKGAEAAALTPAVKAAQAEGGSLVRDVLAAKDLTEDWAKEIYPNAGPWAANPLAQLLASVKITRQSVEGDPLKQLVTVEFADQSDASGGEAGGGDQTGGP